MNAYRVNFQSRSSINKFGDDDLLSQSRRNFIREHYESQISGLCNCKNSCGRLEEYELNKLISGLLGQKVDVKSMKNILLKKKEGLANQGKEILNVDSDLMENLGLYNVMQIRNTNSYRGSSAGERIGALSKLKAAGIKRIVDLAGYENLEEYSKKLGLEYLYYPIENNFFANEAFKTEDEVKKNVKRMGELFGWEDKETRQYLEKRVKQWEIQKETFVKKFVEFIKYMQKDNVYIGCEYGTYTTDNALMLNHFFNPKASRTPSCITQYNRCFIKKLINLAENFTNSDKAQLGWKKGFEQVLLKKLKFLA